MANIGTLMIELAANVARLETDLGKATRHVQNTERMIQQSVGRMNQVFGMLGFTITGAGMVTFIKHSIDLQDELTKLTSAYGINAREAAGLKFAADQSSTSLEMVGKATKELMINMAATPEKFAKLGITAKDATGALAQVADIVEQMPEGQQKVALLAELMGKKLGPEMSEFLSQGGASLREYIAKGQDIYKVTDENARKAKEFKDSLSELEAHVSGLGIAASNELLPGLTQITGAMTEAAREGGLLQAALVGIGGVFAGIFTNDLLSREQQIADRLEELRDRMASNQKWGTLGGLIGMGDQTKAEVNAINNEMIRLMQELEQIQKQRAEMDKKSAEKPKSAPQPVKDLLASLGGRKDSSLKDGFEAEEERWLKSRRAGMQVLIGLEGDYRDELAKRAEAMNMPLLSASEKALADGLRAVSQRAQAARVDLEKLHVSGTLSADAYAQRLAEVTAQEQTQRDAVALLAAEQDRLNQSWSYGASIALRAYLDEVTNTAKQSERLFTTAFKGMEDGLANFLRTGKLDFRSFADSILNEMARVAAQKLVGSMLGGGEGGGLAGIFKTLFSANGNAFNGGALAFANGGAFTNGLFTSPTPFRFAAGGGFGLGVMGEAGPEAVMPLMRGRDGKLGVQAQGGGGAVINHSTNISIDARTDQAEVHRLVSNAVKQGNAELVDTMQRRGMLR